MERYDVIVAGAGPAGSTVARECAVRGLSVLLLDKEAFPRDKPCGGGVNVRAAALLPFDLGPVTERTIFGVQFSLRQSHPFIRRAETPLVYLTQRSRLDTYLVERALAAGARLQERAPLRSVERYSHHVVVRAGPHTFGARALIGADGANGPTARLAGVRAARWAGVAMEGNVTPEAFPRTWEDTLGLDVSTLPGGYGWLFPRGDHVNVGLGGVGHPGVTLRAVLHRLTEFYGFDPGTLWGVRGYHLPVRMPHSALADGNVALVGDAAGLLDPLTGEGIYAAVWSGIVAARHLAAYVAGEVPDLRSYERDVLDGVASEIVTADRWHEVIHAFPAGFISLIQKSPRAWGLVCRILRGEEFYDTFGRRHRTLARWITWLAAATRLEARLLGRDAKRAHVLAPQAG